ncbi:MAG: hypothetical protein PV344_00130 [Anaplasma sp.]|nr:hypothetical protein [Anaplasma sp.]
MPAQDPPLLGFLAIQAFVDNMSSPQMLLGRDLFNGLGELKEEYVIRTRPGAQPFSLSVPRRTLIPFHDVVRKELEKLESDGVIRKVDNPTDWCAGILVVPNSS